VKSERGFTVIELIFVIAIVGLLTSLAVFSTVKWIHEIKVRNFAEELFLDLELAKNLALTKGNSTVVFKSYNGHHYYFIYAPAGFEVKRKRIPEEISVNVTENLPEIVFKHNGIPEKGGHIDIKNYGKHYQIKFNHISGRICLEEM